jgi:hypothetical protein
MCLVPSICFLYILPCVLPFKGDRGVFCKRKERERESENKQTYLYLLCFLKKEEEREEERTAKTRYNDAGYNDILR